jgi:hypothetical protein
MKKCPFCSSEFATNTDFKNHMETFGYNRDKHLGKLEEIHRRAERERLE